MAVEAGQMDKLVALCKRRGFIFPGSEIYGGINGFWDYGPLGVELKRNVKNAWWHDMVTTRDDIVGLDAAIIMNPKVWEASGHVGGFADPMQTCRQCKKLYRADQVWDQLKECEWVESISAAFGAGPSPDLLAVNSPGLLAWAQKKGKKVAPGLALVRNPQVTLSWLAEHLEKNPQAQLDLITLLQFLATEQYARTGLQSPCPNCGGDLTEPRAFNLMFKTYVGAAAEEDDVAYLRPETAQGIFANFKNVIDSTRIKLPFGIAQIGKAFRNEINPRNYTFRSREFEQMEIEFFCHPDEADKWYVHWRDLRYQWYVGLGLKSEKLRLRDHEKDELAHYARGCADVEYAFPFGVSELEGVANRTNYDLTAHANASGKDLSYFDDERKERFVPFVIEPSAGVDRSVLAFLCEAYTQDESRPSPELLKLHPRLAPIKAAVFPLVNKGGMPERAEPIYRDVKKRWPAQFDAKQSIGKRYARMDEAGTPYCVTIDGQTLEDGTVTVRDRDDGSQIRIAEDQVVKFLSERLD